LESGKQHPKTNTKMSTPYQLVKSQCDCHQPDGTCLGITTNDQLQLIRFLKEGSKCLLAYNPIKRCQHFEQAILPYRPENKDSRLESKLQSDWNEGCHTYRIATGFMSEKVRLCPQCRKSKIGEGRKLCDLCKSKNRRESKSLSDHKRNTESNSHSSLNSVVDGE